MALSEKERKALYFARQLIAAGQERYICFALRRIGTWGSPLVSPCDRLRRYISGQLMPYKTLEDWQTLGHGMPSRASHQMREDRIAWIDWMLDEGGRKC